jgi:DNA-binding CsgD family transcriptional regulator
MIEMGWPNPNPAYGQFFTFLHLPEASPEQMRSYNDLLRLTASPATAVGLIWAYWHFDQREIAPHIRCPTLILHARQDAVIPFEEGRSLAALIHGARFVPLESRNHILLANEPAWQQFVDAIEDFLPRSSHSLSAQSLDDLTAREREVLEFIAQGLDNRQISTRLGISDKTVRNHVSIILSKLGISSRSQAIAFARDAGFGRRIGRY